MAADITKTERVISLLILLLEGRSYRLKDIENKLNISERSVFRDIEELNRLGFEIKNRNGRYAMKPDNKLTRAFQKALSGNTYPVFFPEESRDPRHREKAAKMTALIADAITNRMSIRLLDYRSSKGISFPRTLEPFQLNAEDQTLWAFDTSKNDCRQFKILRIGTIETLQTPWQNSHKHRLPFTDIFNLSAAKSIDIIKLRLGDVALNLIREEFPASASFQNQRDTRIFTIPVADYRGAGRFVLGLMDSIEVLGSPAFKKYLKVMVEKYGRYG